MGRSSSQKRPVLRVAREERRHRRAIHAAGKDVDGDRRAVAGMVAGGIDLVDQGVRHRHAADAHPIAVDKDVRSGMLGIAPEAVADVGVVEPEGETEAAVRVEAVDPVDALGHLPVARAPLGSRPTRGGGDGIASHQGHASRRVGGPKLKDSLRLEGPAGTRCGAGSAASRAGRSPARRGSVTQGLPRLDGERMAHGSRPERREEGGGRPHGRL